MQKKWQCLIKKLSDAGFTQKEIAAYAGCTQSYISSMASGARGKAVSFDIGVGLTDVLRRFESGEILPQSRSLNNPLSQRRRRKM